MSARFDLTTLRDQAERYLTLGLPAIPISHGKPLIAWRTYQDRLPTPDEVAGWDWGQADGVAIVLGHQDPTTGRCWWTLDVERQHRAEAESWLDDEHPGWRQGVVAESQRGGLHVYCRSEQPAPTGRCSWGDVKATGGLIYAPPTRRFKPDAVQDYVWLSCVPEEALELEPADLPGGEEQKGRQEPLGDVATIPEGERNSTLTRIAGKLRGNGLTPDELEATLLAINERRCQPPLSEQEVTTIARSVARYTPNPELVFDSDGREGVNSVNSVNSQGLLSVPPYPTHVLPQPVRRFVTESATALDSPAELVANPLLGLTAGVVGNRFTVRLTRSWEEPAILWLGTVAVPGSGKSPAMRRSLAPVNRLQRKAHDRFTDDLAAWERAQQAMKKGDKLVATRDRPEEQHYYTTDSTLEAVVRMIGHPRSTTCGFTMTRDELVSWVSSFNAYRQGGDRQHWLSLWAGASLKVDRAGRDSYFVENPAVSVVGGIQPDLLGALQAEAGVRDGFIERFLFSFPETHAMRLVDAEVDETLVDQVADLLASIRQAPAGTVVLSPEAFAVFRRWHEVNRLAQEHVRGLLQGFYAKLPSQAGRLALVLHVLANPTDPAGIPLSAETMRHAVELAEYFRAHVHKVARHFGVAAQVQDALAVRVLTALSRLPQPATTADLHEALGGHIPAADLRQALEALQQAGLVRAEPVPPGERGGRPGLRWSVVHDPDQPDPPPSGDGERGGQAGYNGGHVNHNQWPFTDHCMTDVPDDPEPTLLPPQRPSELTELTELTSRRCTDCGAELPSGWQYRCPSCTTAAYERLGRPLPEALVKRIEDHTPGG